MIKLQMMVICFNESAQDQFVSNKKQKSASNTMEI